MKAIRKGVFVDWKIIVGGLVVLLILSNGFWWWRQREQFRIVRVIDGDTFVIKSGERVRLIGLDAPEVGKCGSEQATNKLKELVLEKVMKIDRDSRDAWGRKLGIVYVGQINVNLEMIRSGWANYDSFSDVKSTELEKAGEEAKIERLGVYSGICDQKEVCGVLGNIDESSGKKFYHVPGCPLYSQVKITPERGEKVFCTESEAKMAGFSIAPGCVR